MSNSCSERGDQAVEVLRRREDGDQPACRAEGLHQLCFDIARSAASQPLS